MMPNKSLTYTNPVMDKDFPDPSILRHNDGYFYAYATQSSEGEIDLNIQVSKSNDLINWSNPQEAMPIKPIWASKTQDFWAPFVCQIAEKFYMYFSARHDQREKFNGMSMGIALSDNPEGPFKPLDSPLLDDPNYTDIDPMVFEDPITHKRFLYWGSDHDPIRVRELSPDAPTFAPGSKPVELLYPLENQPYETLVEAPYVIHRHGHYFLFYSGDKWGGENARYATMVARSDSPCGPFKRLGKNSPDNSDLILHKNDVWDCPGGQSIITDDANQDWIIYHANRIGTKFGDKDYRRVLMLDRINWESGWPRIENDKPSTTPQFTPVIKK